MNIWLINPFSDLPNEGAAEGRFCCLARMLAEQGHTVTWWTVDFHHRTKARRVAPDGGWKSEARSQWSVARGGLAVQPKTDEPATEELKSGHCEIVPLSVPGYRKNISFARLKSHRDYGKAFADAAAKRIQQDSKCAPDVIHLSVPPLDCVAPALALKKQLGCRVTVDVMDLWPETFTRLIPGGGRVRSLLGRLIFAPMFRKAQRAYREADGVSAVSQEYLDVVKEVAPNQNTHLCYVGGELLKSSASTLSSAEFAPRSPKGHPLSSPFAGSGQTFDLPSTHCRASSSLKSQVSSLKSHPVRFIYVGAMTPTYDLDTVIAAAQQLKESGLKFEVVFAGSGISEPQLKQQVTDLQLGECVTFLGFLNKDELEAALASSDVGLNTIMPGTFITMPHKLSDYLCAGLAVINSTAGEADDLLDAHRAGVFYTVGNVDSLVASMRHYIESPDLVCAQKSAAQSLASEHFDRSKTYSEWANWIVQGG